MRSPPTISTVSEMASLFRWGYAMLESPQKKPLLYGVTAFSSHARNGMEAGGREGGRERERGKKRERAKR